MDRMLRGPLAGWITAAILLTLVFGACQSGKSEGQKQIEELTKAINNVMSEIEGAKTELQQTLDAHNAIVDNPAGDLMTHYKNFAGGLEKLQKREESMDVKVKEFEQIGNAYFAQWKTSIDSFSSEDMKKRAQERYDRTIERFKKIDEAAEAAKTSYGPMMTILKDHQIFLSNDLNAEAAKSLQADDAKIKEKSDTLMAAMEQLLQFGKDYNEAVSMKVDAPEPTKEGGEAAEETGEQKQ